MKHAVLITAVAAVLSLAAAAACAQNRPTGGARNGSGGGGKGSTKTELTADTFKKAGVNQSLSWNTTAPIKNRPILLYLFDSSRPTGRNFELARDLEVKVFADSGVVKLSEGFICEKVCFKNELTQSYKGREVMNAFKRDVHKTPLGKRVTQVVFLSATGELLSVARNPGSTGKFSQQMKAALGKNTRALKAAVEKKVAMR